MSTSHGTSSTSFGPVTERCKEDLQRLVDLSYTPSLAVGLLRTTDPPDTLKLHHQLKPSQKYGNSDQRPMVLCGASLMKIIINYVWCRIMPEPLSSKGITFETDALKLYYHLIGAETNSQSYLSANFTIRDLLLHNSGFSCINRYLLALDGTLMYTNFHHLSSLAIELSKRNDQPKALHYSAFNHIFAARLLELVLDKDFDKILDEYVFKPFGMEHSTVRLADLNSWRNGDAVVVAKPHHVPAANKEALELVYNDSYMQTTIGRAFLGGWTCVEDILSMFGVIFEAYHASSGAVAKDGRRITQEVAQNFLHPRVEAFSKDGGVEMHSLAGVGVTLSTYQSPEPLKPLPGEEQEEKRQAIYRIGINQTKKADLLFYKDAQMLGFTGALFVEPVRKLCLVLLADASGPVELPLNASHIVLREALSLYSDDNIVKCIGDQLWTLQKPEQILEDEDNAAEEMSTAELADYIGRFYDNRLAIGIKIIADAKIFFEAHAIEAGPFPVRRTNKGELYVCPGQKQSVIDRRGPWRNVTFRLEKSWNEPHKLLGGDGEIYIKMPN